LISILIRFNNIFSSTEKGVVVPVSLKTKPKQKHTILR